MTAKIVGDIAAGVATVTGGASLALDGIGCIGGDWTACQDAALGGSASDLGALDSLGAHVLGAVAGVVA